MNPSSQQYMVPGVCRKWSIQFSLVEAKTEILEILLWLNNVHNWGVSTSCATLGAILGYYLRKEGKLNCLSVCVSVCLCVCLSVCLCVCVNEIPMLIFYM
jgi:hypothetical protein